MNIGIGCESTTHAWPRVSTRYSPLTMWLEEGEAYDKLEMKANTVHTPLTVQRQEKFLLRETSFQT